MSDTAREHMAWCKERALYYADRGEATNCINSFISDLTKHEGTQRYVEPASLTMLLVAQGTPKQLREWVEGFADPAPDPHEGVPRV